MRKAKKLSITLMASVMALGVVALQHNQLTHLMAINILIPNAHQYPLQQVMLTQLWALL